MFIRQGSLETVKIYNKIEDIFSDWYGFNRDASAHASKCFEYDPKHFLYYRARAITADTANENGDRFDKVELQRAYPSFIGKGVFYNHANEDPNNAFGLILDANFIAPSNNNAYIEILAAIDKALIDMKVPGLLRRISNGMTSGTSMSCFATSAKCGICGNHAYNLNELCAHMNPKSDNYVKGRLVNAATGEYAFEYNYGITFTEDSVVDNPADNTARIFEVFAANKDKLNKDNLDKNVLATLANALNGLIEQMKQ